ICDKMDIRKYLIPKVHEKESNNVKDDGIASSSGIGSGLPTEVSKKSNNSSKSGLALPPTSVTIERSFSTMRRVKTWLRSSTSEDRLSGFCLLSVYRQMVLENKHNFINKVIDKFGQDRRRLQFLFND
uniref:Uncharacterized protein LOC114347218 n=1 Tax=Diabrotica virgifera virgifera TaxID=50390 RepID=A0A6P7H7R2_DIAVI